MLRGATKKEINYHPLITSFILGVLGGYLNIENINHSQASYTHQRLAYLQPLAQSHKAAAIKNSQAIKTIDAKKALNLVWNLPQVQSKTREIEMLSRGSIQIAEVVDSSPTPSTPFYVVRVFENHPDHTTNPVYWFRVSSSSGVIEPLDLVENQYIALEKWNPEGR